MIYLFIQVINLPQLMHYQSTPQQSQNQFTVQQKQLEVPVLQAVKIELDANLTIEQLNEHLNLKGNRKTSGMYISKYFGIKVAS